MLYCICDVFISFNVGLFVEYNKAEIVATKFIFQPHWLEHFIVFCQHTIYERFTTALTDMWWRAGS